MASKHLKQLLNEDQEPFVLKNYIDEKRCQLKRPVPKTHLQVKRRKPIPENSSFPSSFCKNACFLSFHDSPDVRKSPLFDFSSPAKSPCRNSNTLFVHIPSKTSAMLLEAALRIQQQSASQRPKAPKNLGFGFFGSILKRITHRKRNRKREIEGDDVRASVKDVLRWDSSDGRKTIAEERRENPETTVGLEEKRISEVGFSCSSNGRLSSAWSESIEEKSLDLETSSSRSEDSEEMQFIVEERKNRDYISCEKGFCSSPFQFVLQHSPSLGRQLPEFESPATSPSRYKKQVLNNEDGHLNCVGKEYEEEEEKEQCSPVSVLDPRFEDDDDEGEQEDEQEEEEEKDGFELKRSFANVQRAKQQLLYKLRRFERLAELDPIELEKRMVEEDEDGDDYEDVEEEYDDDYDSVLSDDEKDDGFVQEVLSQSNLYNLNRIPSDMKRLVLDLIAEEREEEDELNDRELVVNKLSKKLDSWEEVESNTIDMMIELDLRREAEEWRKNREQLQETAFAIELSIFSFLVEELSDELVHSSGL